MDEDYPEPFEFEALGLGQRLRVIKARAVAVDAEAKVVQLPDGALVPYDILVLAHGLQESAQRDLVTKAGKDLLPDASDLADWNSPEVDIVAELTKAPSSMEEEATDLTGFVSLSSDNASDELAGGVETRGGLRGYCGRRLGRAGRGPAPPGLGGGRVQYQNSLRK